MNASSTSLSSSSGHPVFSRYRILGRIGNGGMARLDLALDQGALGVTRLVAVKRVAGVFADQTPESHAMLLDEAKVSARLGHPNVVSTYDAGVQDDTFFFAMEYLEGQTLRGLMSACERRGADLGRPWPSHVWIYVMTLVLDGLHYAHELTDFDGTPLGIIHRDVSPQNIFLTYDGRVKLLDFGVAKAALNSHATRTGVVKGKVAYMAPEQATARTLDRRADVFAAGIVLWECLTQRRLFTGDTAQALRKVLFGPIEPVTAFAPDLDPRLALVVDRALAREPEARFASAREMRDALALCIAEISEAELKRDLVSLLDELFAGARDQRRRQVSGWLEEARQRSGFAEAEASAPRDVSEHAVLEPSMLLTPTPTPTMTPAPSEVSLRLEAPVVAQGRWARAGRIAALALAAAVIAGVSLGAASRVGSLPVASAGTSPLAPEIARPTGPEGTSALVPARGVALHPSDAEPSREIFAAAAPAIPATPAPTATPPRRASQSVAHAAPAVAARPPESAPIVATTPPSETPATPPAREVAPAPAITAAPTATPAAPIAAAPPIQAPRPRVLSAQDVDRVVRSHTAEVEACYHRALLDDARLRGQVRVTARVAPDGRVESAAVGSADTRSPRLEACLIGALKSWSFAVPRDGGSHDLSYRFVFD